MIRGSIEIVRRTGISGWIHAESGTVRDRMILAFAGDRCVGAGKVDRFRKDLLEARLGDGYCGFEFPIRLDDTETLGGVTVRLQDSDAALLQRTSRLIGPEDAVQAVDLGAVPPHCVAWMQGRGWLSPADGAFLKAIQTIGAYEQLMPRRRDLGSTQGLAHDAERAARALLGLYAMSPVRITLSRIASLAQLADGGPPGSASDPAQGLSLLALWSAEPCRIAVEERSHLEGGPKPGSGLACVAECPAPGAIDYDFGPDTVLFLHRNASFAPDGAPPAGGVWVFTAVAGTAAADGSQTLAGRAAVAA